MAEKQWDDHKYIARVKVKRKTGSNKDTWRYFYDRAEYQAYLKGQRDNTKDTTASTDKFFGKTVGKNIAEMSVKAREVVDENRKRKILYDTNDKKYYLEDKRSLVDKAKEFASNVLDGMFGKTILDDLKEAAQDYVDDLSIVEEDRKKRQAEKYDGSSSNDFLDEALDKKESEFSDAEDQAAVNPNYDPNDPYGPYNNNCYACTVAYELRQRGYDVEATADADGETLENILDFYEGEEASLYQYNPIIQTEEAVDAVEEELLKHPNGSRGQYIVYWSTGGAHSMAWEITDGEVLIRDCQTNDIYTIEQITPYTNTTVVFRTDNVDLNPEILDCVENRDDRKEEKKYDRY